MKNHWLVRLVLCVQNFAVVGWIESKIVINTIRNSIREGTGTRISTRHSKVETGLVFKVVRKSHTSRKKTTVEICVVVGNAQYLFTHPAKSLHCTLSR